MRRVYGLAAVTVVCLVGSLMGFVSPWFLLCLLPAAVFGYITVLLVLTVYRFSPWGGDYQQCIHRLIADQVGSRPGRVLDVGCGSGSLAIAIAGTAPECTVVGIDAWGEDWEYSQRQCQDNTACVGVADRVTFHQQSAADLAFPDASFDTVVSCLTFHEVRDALDRADAVAEALRVLRPGGRFVFLDLFADPGHFTSVQHVRDTVTQAGCSIARESALHELLAMPYPLRHRKVLGPAMLLVGDRDQDPVAGTGASADASERGSLGA